MKRIVEDESASGLDAALGDRVALWCGVYIYTGILAGVNGDHVELADPYLVYETGPLTTGPWGNAQPLPAPWRVMRQAIESWGPAKC